MPEPSAPGRTDAADYSSSYYLGAHLGPPYTYDEPHWAQFFGDVADALVASLAPRSTYDAGCAIGLLVRALLERGVDARGGDISQFAVEGAPAGLRERLEVKDLTTPIEGRFDLVTCIEVLEHMTPLEAQTAIGNLCAASDTVLLSSTPEDFGEPTHVNVRPPSSWAADFARHGFYRRTDVDASFLSPWATVFSRGELTPAQVVHRYEDLLTPVWREVQGKRHALLETQRELDRLREAPAQELRSVEAALAEARAERDAAVAARNRAVTDQQRLQDDLVRLRAGGEPTDQLVRLALVDELMGVKAELAQARIRADHAVADATVELKEYKRELESTRSELTDVRTSLTWRLGRTALTPVRVARRLRRR